MRHEPVGHEVVPDRAHWDRGWVHLDCSCGHSVSARWDYFAGERATWMYPGSGPEIHLAVKAHPCPLADNEEAFVERVEDYLLESRVARAG